MPPDLRHCAFCHLHNDAFDSGDDDDDDDDDDELIS